MKIGLIGLLLAITLFGDEQKAGTWKGVELLNLTGTTNHTGTNNVFSFDTTSFYEHYVTMYEDDGNEVLRIGMPHKAITTNWFSIGDYEDRQPLQNFRYYWKAQKQVGYKETNLVVTLTYGNTNQDIVLKQIGRDEWPVEHRLNNLKAVYPELNNLAIGETNGTFLTK